MRSLKKLILADLSLMEILKHVNPVSTTTVYSMLEYETLACVCIRLGHIKKGQLSVAESFKTWSNQNLLSSQWSVLLFCTHWHCLRSPCSKGTFTNHHHPGLPAFCSQNRLLCTTTDCDIAHEPKRQPLRGLHSCPGRCLIGPIYPTNSPCLPSCLSSSLIHLSAAAKFHTVYWMVVNALGLSSVSIVLQRWCSQPA